MNACKNCGKFIEKGKKIGLCGKCLSSIMEERECNTCGKPFLAKKYDRFGNKGKQVKCKDCWSDIHKKSIRPPDYYPSHLKHADPVLQNEIRWLHLTGRKEKAAAALQCKNWDEYIELDRKQKVRLPKQSSITGTNICD